MLSERRSLNQDTLKENWLCLLGLTSPCRARRQSNGNKRRADNNEVIKMGQSRLQPLRGDRIISVPRSDIHLFLSIITVRRGRERAEGGASDVGVHTSDVCTVMNLYFPTNKTLIPDVLVCKTTLRRSCFMFFRIAR